MIQVGIGIDECLRDVTESLPALTSLVRTGLFEFYAVCECVAPIVRALVARSYANIFTDVVSYDDVNSISIYVVSNPELVTKANVRIIHYSSWDNIIKLLSRDELIAFTNEHMNPNILLAISGKIGSGKDALFDIIKNYYPMFEKRVFAAKIKKIASIITGVSVKSCYTREGKAFIPPGFDISVGVMLQKIGSSMKESLGEAVWSRAVVCDLLRPSHCVITDCRFKVEVEDVLRVSNSAVIRVDGDPVGIRRRNEDGRDLNHISETDLDDYEFEYRVSNDETLIELGEKVMKIVVPMLYNMIVL